MVQYIKKTYQKEVMNRLFWLTTVNNGYINLQVKFIKLGAKLAGFFSHEINITNILNYKSGPVMLSFPI